MKTLTTLCLTFCLMGGIGAANAAVGDAEKDDKKIENQGEQPTNPNDRKQDGDTETPTSGVDALASQDTTFNSLTKYNYLFYFIYKYKYESQLGVEDLKTLNAE